MWQASVMAADYVNQFSRTSRSAIIILLGEEVWLIGERRSTRERKYYRSTLPVDTQHKTLAGAIKARWICEKAQPHFKEKLSLDRFEG